MRIFALILLVLYTALALAQREMTVVSLSYADPKQIAEVIRPYLSQESSVSVYQNQLVLNATAAELAKTHELLQKLDSPGRQLLISVRSGVSGNASQRRLDIDSVIKSGNTTITTGSPGRGDESRTVVRANNSQISSSDHSEQTLRVTEGLPAYISTGVSAPVNGYVYGSDGRRYYQQDYANAVSGFYATAWVNGSTVKIHIDQRNDKLEGRLIDSQQLQSNISGRLGQWITIGGIDNASTRRESDWTAQGKSAVASTTAILLKVDTLD
jgi:hypothetical protein